MPGSLSIGGTVPLGNNLSWHGNKSYSNSLYGSWFPASMCPLTYRGESTVFSQGLITASKIQRKPPKAVSYDMIFVGKAIFVTTNRKKVGET